MECHGMGGDLGRCTPEWRTRRAWTVTRPIAIAARRHVAIATTLRHPSIRITYPRMRSFSTATPLHWRRARTDS